MLELAKIIFSTEFVYAAIRMTTPLLFAAMGGLLAERAGILILSLEGMMVAGALFGFLGSFWTGSTLVGILLAMVAGAGIGLIYAFVTISCNANQVVTAVGVNILATGITSVIFRGIFGNTVHQISAQQFQPLNLSFLSKIPFFGRVFFNHIGLVYLAFLMVPVIYYLFYYTKWGLTLRAVGEDPKASDSVGISVRKVRYLAVILSGVFAGIGGATLSIGYLNRFVEGMVAGRGWIAFSAIVLGGWKPVGVFIATVLFGTVDALQLRIQAFGLKIPFQFLIMLPYVVTLLSLFAIGKLKAPAAQGQPYEKE